jgi:hypothetical protein
MEVNMLQWMVLFGLAAVSVAKTSAAQSSPTKTTPMASLAHRPRQRPILLAGVRF